MMRYQCLQNFISIASAQSMNRAGSASSITKKGFPTSFPGGRSSQRIKRSGWERRASASASASGIGIGIGIGIGSGDDEAIIMPRRGKPLEHPDLRLKTETED
jgi:hypothetical protein